MVAAATVPALVLAGSSPAHGAVGAVDTMTTPPVNVVEISSTDSDFTAPATAAPGIAEFRVSTTTEASGWIGLARLNEGVSWETFRENLAKTVSDTPSEVIEGSAALAASATLLGGVVIHPGLPGAFTQHLEPGEYLLFDYKFLSPTNFRYRYLSVVGGPRYSPLSFSGSIVATSVPGVGPRFTLFGQAKPGQGLLMYNGVPGQLIEAVMFPIADDVTDARLQEWFDSFQDGDPSFPPNPPFDLDLGRGLLPLSPGRTSVINVPLTPGRYVVVNWLKDAQTGTRLVKQGHYFVIEVR